ncbi:hypothetical protein CBL_13724 [Carabus blaptoides fortunei]
MQQDQQLAISICETLRVGRTSRFIPVLRIPCKSQYALLQKILLTPKTTMIIVHILLLVYIWDLGLLGHYRVRRQKCPQICRHRLQLASLLVTVWNGDDARWADAQGASRRGTSTTARGDDVWVT